MTSQKLMLESSNRNLFITFEVWIAATIVVAPLVIARYPLSIAPTLVWATFLAVGTAVWSFVALWALATVAVRSLLPQTAHELPSQSNVNELSDMPAVPQSRASKQEAA